MLPLELLQKTNLKVLMTLLFSRALQKYPRAFISLVYTKQYGLWIGASPEILLEHNLDEFKTLSLAGTKANTPANKQTPWGKKKLKNNNWLQNI